MQEEMTAVGCTAEGRSSIARRTVDRPATLKAIAGYIVRTREAAWKRQSFRTFDERHLTTSCAMRSRRMRNYFGTLTKKLTRTWVIFGPAASLELPGTPRLFEDGPLDFIRIANTTSSRQPLGAI